MNNSNNFKLFLPGIANDQNNGITVIAADLRKEKTTVGLYKAENRKVTAVATSEYVTSDYASFSEMVKQFVADHAVAGVSRITVAVPGPVIGGKSEPPRLPWKLDAEEIRNAVGVEKVYLLNDLEASAFGLENVADDKILPIHTSANFTPGNVAILAPGAGLGEAGLFWDGATLRPFATEGGHCEFSPRTADEIEFYQFLNEIYGIVSWESVLSASGLFNIFRFIRDIKRQIQPNFLTHAIDEGNFVDAVIKGALENEDRTCKMTVETFLIFMAREANSLVLKLKATGGLILTGELALLMEKFLVDKKFYKHFIVSDKMEALLQDIPIYLVKDQHTIISGAALYAAFFKN
ncbi:MAG: glucokinase [Chryseobacterium sp. 39-10]|nr:glucokinase [Chryseobacterium sp.]OJV47754.1 MAG: glucokinase [Chryseobacterium sp. 39-10]